VGLSNQGFTADADGGATGNFSAKDEPVGEKIGAALDKRFPTTSALGNALFGSSQQAPQSGQTAATVPIYGVDGANMGQLPDYSWMLSQTSQPKSGGVSSFLKAIIGAG
jgi:hypothetical protein